MCVCPLSVLEESIIVSGDDPSLHQSYCATHDSQSGQRCLAFRGQIPENEI